MQDASGGGRGGSRVSLRGASAREVSRDDLIEKAAQERASRQRAKREAGAALTIQRVWRGRRAAERAADGVGAAWDAEAFDERKSGSFSAREVADRVVRPLLFLVRRGASFSARVAANAGRLATGLRLLLESMNCGDPGRNYFSLAVGEEEGGRAGWLFQVHGLLEFCSMMVGRDGGGGKRAVALLPGLAMRVMVALTDASMWKSCAAEDEGRRAGALVVDLLEWLARGGPGLLPAIRSYVVTHYPIPEGDRKHDQPPDRDKLIVTAGALTMALRPMGVFAAAAARGGADRGRMEASLAFAAEMFSAHVLTIPFLVQRLPASLVPALWHPSALAPCLRSFRVSTKSVMEMAAKLPPGESEVGSLPGSMWALANVVSLASGSGPSSAKDREFDGRFVKGLVVEEYVEALCCLLKDLDPWVEGKRQESARAGRDLDAEDDGGGLASLGVRPESSTLSGRPFLANSAPDSVFRLLQKTLRPLCQSWHLTLLLEACQIYCEIPGESKAGFGGEQGEGGGAREKDIGKRLGLPAVAKLYSSLLATFSGLSPIGGQLPILNLLAFSHCLLPRLWEWLQHSLQLRLPAARDVNESKPSGRGATSVSKEGSSGKPPSGRWAAAFGLKSKAQSSGGEGASNADKPDSSDEATASRAWDLQPMRRGPGGMPEDAVPVLSLFCATYAHLLVVVDDEEFYERQVPFTMDQQRLISAMLNTMVYNRLIAPSKDRFPLLTDSAVRCLRSLYERDCRRSFCEPALWLSPALTLHRPTAAAARAHHEAAAASARISSSFQAPGVGAVLHTIPHVLPFQERVHIFRELVRWDKGRHQGGGGEAIMGPGTIEIAVRRDHVVEDGFAQLSGLGSKLKSCINVSFVNELGLSEAGLDYGGLFKEFLTNLAKAAFDPGYGLFVQTATEEGLLFPHQAAGSLGQGLPMIEFLGQIIGKALYEGILLEYSFAPLFVSKLLGRYSFLDELSTLDAELHRNLMYLKHYEGDARDLALDFTVTEELFGKHTSVELRPGGADMVVTNENKLQYVHAMADYKLNWQMKPVISAFLRGLSHLIDPAWLGLFNAKEFNELLSGRDHDFDVGDLRAHTRYTGGFTDSSRTVKLFWEVVEGLEAHERCALLKFVTSCSRAPLLGFKHLQPAFTIHKVVCDAPVWAIIGGQDVERLPSASTCYNTLKLPTYKRVGTLREKLRYAISSNAGFELS